MLKLRVMGDPFSIHRFMTDFKSQPQYDIKLESQEYDMKNVDEVMVLANFEFKPTVRHTTVVKLMTPDQTEIKLKMLDGQVIEMNEGVTYISGKVYDLFW